MTAENDRRTALARSRHLYPGSHSMPKPGELSKQELRDMLREAVVNTQSQTTEN
jgi:hypothetical protein